MTERSRPTKKQREMLDFIGRFIAEHGYSPSYREIKNGLNYGSVATVAVHINNLIKRGHLSKKDFSARSLELSNVEAYKTYQQPSHGENEEKWLVSRVDEFFKAAEAAGPNSNYNLDGLYVLVGALKVLGYEAAARSFISRLSLLKGTK